MDNQHAKRILEEALILIRALPENPAFNTANMLLGGISDQESVDIQIDEKVSLTLSIYTRHL